MANFFYKTYKKMESVSFILKFIPSSYIKNLLDIVVKLKIKKCWPNVMPCLVKSNYGSLTAVNMA